jgi:hypothetical protein
MGNNSGHTGSEIKAKAVAWGQSTLNLRNPVGLRLEHFRLPSLSADSKSKRPKSFSGVKSLANKTVRLGLTA